MSAPFKVRASSWGSLFDCSHRWEGTHILGLRMPSSPRALLGKGIHHGTAVFDTGRIIGQPVDPIEAVEQAIEQIQRPEEEVDWKGDDLSVRDMQKIAASLVTKYCVEIAPRYRFRAVELTTEPMEIDCGNGVSIILTGTLDRCRIREESGGLGIADVKSGRAAVADGKAKTRGHAAQVGTYEILAEHTLGEPITEDAEIIGLKTTGKPEAAVSPIKGARRVMLGDGDSPGLMQYAAEMFRSGLFPPNPQSVLCNPKYCARWAHCKFHD